MSLEKICLNPKCGKLFTPKNPKGKYCSANCKAAHQYILKTGGPKEKISELKKLDPSLKTANEVIVPGKNLEVRNPGANVYKITQPPWVQKIEDYCQEEGITPEKLIDEHKLAYSNIRSFKKIKNKEVKVIPPQEDNSIINSAGLSEKQLEIRKKKMGF